MKNKWLVFIPLLSILLFLSVVVLTNPDRVLALQTIPSRTPKPDSPTDPPPEPTKDDNNGGGDDDNNQPSSTPTPQSNNTPAASPTSVLPTVLATATSGLDGTSTSISKTATPTGTSLPATTTATATKGSQIEEIAAGTTPLAFPIDGTPFPTAEPCGEPPTITSLKTTKVYEGPGFDYPVVATIGTKEVYPIVGRAAFATWWLVQLDEYYAQAWIRDSAGIVHGFMGKVPIITAPSINGASPTPGDRWDPTPVPICTPTVSPTSTPSPTAEVAVISGSLLDTASTSAEKVNSTIDGETAVDARNELAESAAPLELEGTSTTPAPNLLPIAGLVLVIAAIFVALFLRRNPGADDTSS